MSAIELLSHLRRRDVRLWVEDGHLRYNAPKGELQEELRSEIRKNKAELLDLLKKANRSLQAPPLVPVRRNGNFPLSFAQQRLWFLNQLEPESSAYHMTLVLRLQGPLNVTALERSLEEIIRRHESLRTTFSIVEGEPVQMVAPPGPFSLPVVDIHPPSLSDVEVEAKRVVNEERGRLFDLATGPLFRPQLLRLGDEDHVFLLSLHHIVADAWSMGVLRRELTTLYGAFLAGQPSPLQELPIQYTDFAHWQRQWLMGDVLETQLDYWRTQLADLSLLQFPTDHPRPPIQTYAGSTHAFLLPMPLLEGLSKLSQEEGTTLAITLLAAFQVLLARYTGQTDIVVGLPIANRNRRQIEGLIGIFLNSLVMRTDVSGDPSFREVLRRVKDVAMGSYDHQDLPFEKLVEELHPERDLSRNPLFQVMFTLQNVPSEAFRLSGVTVSPFRLESRTTHLDLECLVSERADGLQVVFSYNTDLFDATTIARLGRHFQRVLEGVVLDANQRFSRLPILEKTERQQLVVEWNATEQEYSSNTCLQELVESQVERTPDAVAVVFEDEHLTYRQLNALANRVAHDLKAQGVGPEVRVGLCLERGLELMVGLLAILKAGGAYVPLDPAYPRERLAFILQDAQVSLVVSQEVLVERLPTHEAKMVWLDQNWTHRLSGSHANPTRHSLADHLAYVIYTSGSTGLPKGVQISHRALVNFLEGIGREVQLTAKDTIVAITSLSFDIAALELYLPLLRGGRVVIVNSSVAADDKRLGELLAEAGATFMQATPATWQMLVDSGWGGSPHLTILCGGEALSKKLAEQLKTRGASVWNLYGPTETTVWSASACMGGREPFVSIGRPLANTQLYVLDRHLEPVPVGIPGELHIGGVGLARGYLGRAMLTSEKFIPDPFSTSPGRRLYKTGDLVRYKHDGELEWLGRLDHQVKIRGFRIELGEIESVLRQEPGIREAVVMVKEVGQGDNQLVAYLVSPEVERPNIPNLRRTLRARLPGYMIPSAFVFLDTVPLTPNGKVDRKALPFPDRSRPLGSRDSFAPLSALESVIADVWREILGIEQVTALDNFLDLGGHSLLALKVIHILEPQLGYRLELRDLFFQTLSQLAAMCEDHPSEKHVDQEGRPHQ